MIHEITYESSPKEREIDSGWQTKSWIFFNFSNLTMNYFSKKIKDLEQASV